MICLDCVTGKWVVTKDEEGWAELTFTEKSAMDWIMEGMAEDLRRDLNRTSYLTRELEI